MEDPKHLGRVRVRFQWPVAAEADAESGWLRVSTPYSGDGKGQLFTPEKHSQVLVGYEQGLAAFPVVLGNLFHHQNPQGAKYTTPSNHLKGLQTAGGNKVVMNDTKDAQTILLSNSNNKETAIEIEFKGDSSITIKSNGPINITSGDSISLKATNKISLTADEISLQADEKIVLDSSRTVDIEGGAAVKVSGQTLELEARTTASLAGQTGVKVEGLKAELSSSTMTSIKGTMVKVN